ncbi:hypothetical protein AZSI13_32340 [Azospira sp. I13]|uniref:hypothetical protein n=1 Tax=Azospira sp. I13 TaxID=1765050 RepID=UPI000D46EE36|nr:hypothetical protein [Azospira sp. I13]GBG03907.1 hypothetical protein AZSI13_32340 [Azospira sp. I13]
MTTPEKEFSQAQKAALQERATLIAATQEEIASLLEVAYERIALVLAGAPTDYQQWHLEQLQRQVAQAITELGAAAGTALSEKTTAAWHAGVGLIDKPLAAAGVSVQLPYMDTRLLVAIRSFGVERIKDMAVQAGQKINQELGLAMIGAQGVHDTIGKVKTALGEAATGRAATIVRDGLSTAYAVASQARSEQANEVVPMDKIWRRSGKIHSRLNHDLADGQRVPVDKPFIIQTPNGPVKMMHPHDPRAPIAEKIHCGCISVPKVRSWSATVSDKKPYSAEEIRRNPHKADLSAIQAKIALQSATIEKGQGEKGRHEAWIKMHRELPDTKLQQAIRSFTRQIDKHQGWIANPLSKTTDYANFDKRRQAALLKGWQQDIERHQEFIAILKLILEERRHDH